MSSWKVYYMEGNKVVDAYAVAPENWNAERVQRTMRTQSDIAGSVLVEEATEVVVDPKFNLIPR